jgi:hypothetical protein
MPAFCRDDGDYQKKCLDALRRLEGRCSQLVRFADGKAVEEHLYYDQMDVITQLGLTPPAGATA